MATYRRYTVMDADTGKRFSARDFPYIAALRERNRLAIHYGKAFALVVAGIDRDGRLHEINEDDEA
jgi:hypothetical protein